MAIASIAVTCVAVSPADAGWPALHVQWKLDGGIALDEMPRGVPNGMGGFVYTGGGNDGAVMMTYSLVGIPDARVSANYILQNFSMATVEIELWVTLPITPAVTAPSSLTGSVAVGMTADADGGTLAALPGVSFWQAMIDGSAMGGGTDLLTDLLLERPGLGSMKAEDIFLQLPGPQALNDIGILITFSLTAGEQMSLTSVFDVVPIPGPAGLAVLGLATLVVRRRRR
jgi:hypothetical protein